VTDVTCSSYRELISARVDGELDQTSGASLDTHLATCAPCAAFEQDGYALRRTLQMRVATAGPETLKPVDLTGSLQAVSLLRWSLFVIGGTLVALNAQAIFMSGGTTADHLSRHDGVFGTALGIGMLAVAAKPHRAIGLVPLTSAIAVLMMTVAAADLIAGSTNLLTEAVHVVELAGLICLWVISGGPSRVPKHIAALTHRVPGLTGG